MVVDNNPFILLDDARASAEAAPARLYRDPIDIITTNDPGALDSCFARIASAQADGRHVAGYCAYEAGLALEHRLIHHLPANPAGPLLWFGVFADYRSIAPEQLTDHLPNPSGAWIGALRPDVSPEQYRAAFDQVIGYIEAGDIYQANLTFSATARYAGHPLALYAAIRAQAGAGYGGVVFDGAQWLLSFSPELFFALQDGRVTAKPMKGTAAREGDPGMDEAVRRQLQNDPKQRAENLMIVDLLRNDLSKVAVPGSVKVPDLFQIESYPTIHQMTSTVTAQLAPDHDPTDLIRQIFPCGSITGAPKIRAMEIIADLENRERGIYCGSIGRVDAPKENGHSDAAFNVAIRTMMLNVEQETLSIGLGSGIVADSNGIDEWRECLAKGRFAAVKNGNGHDVSVDLIETMMFDPMHGIARLEAHLERMKKSAAALDFEFDRHAARNTIQAITFHQDRPAKVRLMLARSGAVAIELQPMPAPLNDAVPVKLVPMQAQAEDFRLHHKTSDRRVYDAPDLDDGVHPVFVDADGFVTEGAIWSVFVERDGQLLTPPLSRGLLPGVLRAELLEQGKAVEADIHIDDLDSGLFLGNSLRGLTKAQIV